jgi:hypothetical protein
VTQIYPYTQNDLLAGEPYHYHYTAYQGPAFLEAYHRDRLAALARFECRAGNAPGAAGAPPFAGLYERPLETAAELAAAASWVARGGDVCRRDLVALVDALMRKFEISKRLRSRYGVGLRVEMRDSAPIDAYCHLAFLVARCPEGWDRLWRLNALLKLNDLVISADTGSLPPDAAWSAARAIRMELDAVRALAREKGVAIP